MKYFFFLFFSLLLFSNLLGCGSSTQEFPQEKGLQIPRLFMSGDLNPLNLVGRLEVFLLEGEKEILEKKFDLTIRLIDDRLQLIPPEGIRIEGLREATYVYRISLSHRSAGQEDILLTTIKEEIFMQRGIENGINFNDSHWEYNYDKDEDGYTNVTELMNGRWISATEWNYESTDPEKIDLKPSKVQSFGPFKVGVSTPGIDGISTLRGFSHSVSAGVLIIVVHSDISQNEKGKYKEFSRLDGSFEIPIKNSIVGDKLQIYTISLPSKEGENPNGNPFISLSQGAEGILNLTVP